MAKEVTARRRNKDSNEVPNESKKSKPNKKEKNQPIQNGKSKKSSKENKSVSSSNWILTWLSYVCVVIIIASLSIRFFPLKRLNNTLQLKFGVGIPFVNNPRRDLETYAKLLEKEPTSVVGLVGKAIALDQLSHIEESNFLLDEAIEAYLKVITFAEANQNLVPRETLLESIKTVISRMTFRGSHARIIPLLERVTPWVDDLKLNNTLGRAYLLNNSMRRAKEVFHNVLQKWPNNGFAQAHYGFTLKILDNNLTEAVKYLSNGIKSEEEGTQEKQLYIQVGDAYQRLEQDEKAYEFYDIAASKGLFLSRFQRPLDFIPRLKAKPIWSIEETTYEPFFRKLASNWERILAEALPLINLDSKQGFKKEEYLRRDGEWGQFMLYDVGIKNETNCAKAPFTCSLIDEFPPARTNRRGQTKFSLLKPGTTVFKHTGPSNLRLRSHLGLITPPGAALRVIDANGPQLVTWEAGKIFVFDDSFEHEVWHHGDTNRLILLVDVWHPEVTEEEKISLHN